MSRVSAYILCHNSAATILQAIESVRSQSVPADEFFVVDDCSSDASPVLVERAGVRLIRAGEKLGRGAARAMAMSEATCDLVLSCDSGITLSFDFLERSLPWFEDARVAAVHGRVLQPVPENAVERWRGRHLFKVDKPPAFTRQSSLLTGGAVIRRAAAMEVGNFDASLVHSEDKDLGVRLLAAGYDVLCDPSLEMTAVTRNDLGQVLERYWRWHAGKDEAVSLRAYLKQVAYSVKVMAVEDLQAGDPAGALISLFSPHYQFWKSFLKRCS